MTAVFDTDLAKSADILLVQELRLHSDKPQWLIRLAKDFAWKAAFSEPPPATGAWVALQVRPQCFGSNPLERFQSLSAKTIAVSRSRVLILLLPVAMVQLSIQMFRGSMLHSLGVQTPQRAKQSFSAVT